jgi:hypothetical protein
LATRKAAEIGIDNLEHGLFADTEFVLNKQPDQCPQVLFKPVCDNIDYQRSRRGRKQIRGTLVSNERRHHVDAAVFEAACPVGPIRNRREHSTAKPARLIVMNTDARVRYMQARAPVSSDANFVPLSPGMEIRGGPFVKRGWLISGLDPNRNADCCRLPAIYDKWN